MSRNKIIFSLSILLLLLSACSPAPTQEPPTPTLAPTATNTPLPTETPTPSPTPTPETPEKLQEMGFEVRKVGEDWILFDGDDQMGELVIKEGERFLEITVGEEIYEINIDKEKVFEYEKTGITVADLDQKTESGYELGVVWRDGEWRELLLNYEPKKVEADFSSRPPVVYESGRTEADLSNLPPAVKEVDFQRQVEKERILIQELSNESLPVNDFTDLYHSVFIGLTENEKNDWFFSDRQKYPAQLMGVSKLLAEDISGDEVEVIMLTWAIRDKSGSKKLAHMIGFEEDLSRVRNEGASTYFRLINLERLPEFNTVTYISSEHITGKYPLTELVYWLNLSRADEIEELMIKLKDSDIFPKELETAFFGLATTNWTQAIISE